jgi:hypothetical protein
MLILVLQEARAGLAETQPQLTPQQAVQWLGKQWSSLTTEQKAPYIKEAAKLMVSPCES